MAHKVVSLGFGSCEKQVKHVKSGLSKYYEEDVEGFSYRKAHSDSKSFYKMVKGADVITLSAGLTTVLPGTKPKSILGIAPPMPTSILRLISRATRSGYDLVRSIDDVEPEWSQVRRECSENFAVEVSTHLAANLGRIGVIAKFNAVEAAIAAQEDGIAMELLFMNQDKLFQVSEEHKKRAQEAGLTIVTIDGTHEDFACEPVRVVDEYRTAREKLLVA